MCDDELRPEVEARLREPVKREDLRTTDELRDAMRDDRPATELWDALEECDLHSGWHVGYEGYRAALAALEKAAESLNNVGAHVPAEKAWDALATQRERLLEALR